MSVKLAKKTGGSSIGEHIWAADGDVCEVDDGLAAELLEIAPAEFTIVVADTKPAKKGAAAPRTNTSSSSDTEVAVKVEA